MDPAALAPPWRDGAQSGLRAGFSSWFEFALLAEEKSRIMASVMAALQQRGVRSALNTWSAFAAEHAEARRQLQSAASAFRGDGVHKAFNTWHELSATLALMSQALNVSQAPPDCLPANTGVTLRRRWHDSAKPKSA